MKVDIEKEIIKEKMNELPDWILIGFLNKIKAGDVTQFNFNKTARFYAVEEFKKKNPKTPIHKMCAVVVEYLGGFTIEVLSNNTYSINLKDAEQCDEVDSRFETKSMTEAQDYLWENIAKEQLIN